MDFTPTAEQHDAGELAKRILGDRCTQERLREVEESILARAPEHDLEPSLDRIRAVMELADDPQRTYPVIHLTGTNGKTTTARVIESVLREMGLTTGRFTSPHLHTMLERIAIGGRPIGAEQFLAAYDDVVGLIDRHDVLRTAVAREGLREPVQVVWRHAPLPVEEVELGAGAGAAEQLWRRYDPRRYRMDLGRAPLLQACIAEDRASGRWLLLMLRHSRMLPRPR